SQLPKGARIYLPDEAARKRYVEGRLLDVFARWGYREIVTPTFEFADVLAMGTDLGVQESMFKFVDRETGRMLALRADITPQIARVVRGLAPPPHVAEALLALPTLFGREIVLERAGRYAQNPRSTRALANLAEVYRLLRIYGLADSVLLDLGEVRGFDYYSGLY